MKAKFLLFIIVAGMTTFISCGPSKEEQEAAAAYRSATAVEQN